jgi:ABC-type branched-subunit amino acid transport system ATPase component
MTILKIENLSKSFGERKLFENLSLELEEGKIYSLMGANGTGKTTLFNILTGFVKADLGKVIFKNHDILSKSPAKINKMGIARTFQDLRLINSLTVKENVILSMKNNPSDNWMKSMLPENFHSKTNILLDKRASEIIEQFFLSDVTDSLASDISYGQQKLLSLACCVANGASLLLLDEPVAGIQPEFRNKIAALIVQMKEQEKTILLIEHNTDFIDSVTGDIFFVNNRNISIFGNVSELRADTMVMESYF